LCVPRKIEEKRLSDNHITSKNRGEKAETIQNGPRKIEEKRQLRLQFTSKNRGEKAWNVVMDLEK
jgi:hypothetical protein